jgi:hypothetical protein
MSERLFKNKFIRTGEEGVEDTPVEKISEFRRFHESKKEKIERNKKLDQQKDQINNYQGARVNSVQSVSSTRNEKNSDTLYQLQPSSKFTEVDTVVCIDSRDRNLSLYPHQHEFETFLGKNFFNVSKIQLVSTEIPNTDQVIKQVPIELKNNRISWQNAEDMDIGIFGDILFYREPELYPGSILLRIEDHGIETGKKIEINVFNSKQEADAGITGIIDGMKEAFVVDKNTLSFDFLDPLVVEGTCSVDTGLYIYHVDVKPGNYSARSLALQIQNDINKIKRRGGKGQFHFFEVSVNLDTDIMVFDSVITTRLPSNSLSTLAGTTILTVNQREHGFKTGERVKMIGVKQFAGIPTAELNGDFIVNVVDFNSFTIEVLTRASETTDGGGNTIRTGKGAPFRLLFDTEMTKIQINTGFPDEDSSESVIGSESGASVSALAISDVEKIDQETIRVTTTEPHWLEIVKKFDIISIENYLTNRVLFRTSHPHGLELPSKIFVRNTNCLPEINGSFFAFPNGPDVFYIKNAFVSVSGNSGTLLYNGDRVKIKGLDTVPSVSQNPIFFVENIFDNFSFDVKFNLESINLESVVGSSVGTSRLTIKHQDHGFNELVSIDNHTRPGFLKILLANENSKIFGRRITGANIEDGPVSTNTIDILVPFHFLETSDEVVIIGSNSFPIIDGTYKIQKVSDDVIRINFIHENADFIPGACTVLIGGSVVLSETNCFPRVNGSFHVDNTRIISRISEGTITSMITTTQPHDLSVGDQIILKNTNSTPVLDGTFFVFSVIDSMNFTVSGFEEPIVLEGNFGIITFSKKLIVESSGIVIENPGISPAGIIGKNDYVSLYRIQSSIELGSTLGDIPLKDINQVRRKITRILDKDNYMIRIPEEYSNIVDSSDATAVFNVSSIFHGFREKQANTIDGTPESELFRSISLEGENYIYITLDNSGIDFRTILNTTNIPNTFAKVILTEPPGNMCFNSFISEARVFKNPIARLDTLKIRVVDSRGFSFNFSDINYSISLKITEVFEDLDDTGLSSRSNTDIRLRKNGLVS